MKILFICNQNINRSKTAEKLFSKDFKTRSAGLFNDVPVTKIQLSWADTIVVMEEHQRHEIADRFPEEYLKKRIISLDIPDIYHYDQPELVDMLKDRFSFLF